jgi:hypothetical protein
MEEEDEEEEEEGEEGEEEEEEEGFEVSDNGEDGGSLIIDEPSTSSTGMLHDSTQDLASVSKLLNTATNQSFQKFFDHDEDEDGSSGSNNTTSPVERKKSAYSAAPHKISCPYCARKFPWTSSLKRHILTHTGHKPYKCSECNLWFTTKSNCDRHLVRKHGGSNNNNGDHHLQAASYTMRNVPERPYKCRMCPSSTFSSQSNLRKHHFTKHLNMEYIGGDDDEEDEDDEDADEDGDDEFSVEESTDDPSPFRCHICSLGFDVRALALTHMRTSHVEECASIEASVNSKMEAGVTSVVSMNGATSKEGVECIFCPNRFKTFLDLRRHVRKDHGIKYTCDICQKSFALKNALIRHKKKHDSGVSSGDDSEVEQQQQQQQQQQQPQTSSVKKSLDLQPKKKPSLMDTINKLSSANKDSKATLDNLFSSAAVSTTAPTTSSSKKAEAVANSAA